MTRIFVILILLATLTPARADDSQAFDPKAKLVFEQMVRAYRSLHALDQETTYESKPFAMGRFVGMHLTFARPNFLVLEITERIVESDRPATRRFVSDGKDLYAYQSVQSYYTKDKAPKDITGFKEMAASIEMAILAGMDVFGQLERQAHSARMEEGVLVDTVMTDVVALDVGTPERSATARFFIGQTDHLLRRFTLDSQLLLKPKSMVDNPDPMDEAEITPPPMYFGYENHILNSTDVSRDVFRWVAPGGALLLNEIDSGGQPKKHGKGPSRLNGMIIANPVDLSQPTQPLDLSKATKKVSANELIEKAKKQKK